MSFPQEAMDFFAELTLDNTREFWEANTERHLRVVRAPMEAIAAGLTDEFGTTKLYRPNRDVRFSADKSPYKTHQGLVVMTAPACGWYLEVNADAVVAGGGFYRADPANLAAFREAVDDDIRGPELERLAAELADEGYEIWGDRVKTAPRGWPRTHPRIDLLRWRAFAPMTDIDPSVEGPEEVLEEVRRIWRRVEPVMEWLDVLNVDPSEVL